MKTNFRQKVMKYAHQIFKSTGESFAICLMKAWQIYRLSKEMHRRIVRFAYRKVDGSIRHAEGTLMNVPSGSMNRGKRMTKPSYKTFSYFDAVKGEMRCFKVENLIMVY